MKKRYYEIDAYTKDGRYFEFKKSNLTTIFYCLRDCINSGLYTDLYFNVWENDAHNKFLINQVCFMPAGNGFIKATARAMWYFNRFKSYISNNGTRKEINFINQYAKKGI